MAKKNLLLYLGQRGFGYADGQGIQLENSDVNDLVLNGTNGSSANEGDNLICEDVLINAQLVTEELDERGTIRLDGIDPIPVLVFLTLNGTDASETNAGDNIILETNVSTDTDRILQESSIVTFASYQVTEAGQKLLQDDPTNADDLPMSEYSDLRFMDIRRSSRILLDQKGEDSINGKLSPKIITERDGVTPLQTEEDNGTFIILQDATHNGADDPHRRLTSGQGDINSGTIDEDGIDLEGGGFLLLDGTNTDQDDAGGKILDSNNFSLYLEENGLLVQEDYESHSIHGVMLTEDSVIEKRLRMETSLEPEPKDSIELEDGSQDTDSDMLALNGTDSSSTNAGEKIRMNQDFADRIAEINNILLEETTMIGNRGQIPHENYTIEIGQDRPLAVITKGQQNIVQGAYISLDAS